MRVILTAFGGKLRSAPHDWPDGTGPQIRLTLDMDGSQWCNFDGKMEQDEPSRPAVGIFEDINRYEFGVSGEPSARIYRLIRVEDHRPIHPEPSPVPRGGETK